VTSAERQQQRLLRGVVQCQEVINAKRRLGGDASDKELADDKRRARRVQHRLRTSAHEWLPINNNTVLPQPDGSGMRLDWAEWWEAWRVVELDPGAKSSDIHKIERELEALSEIFAELR
jgi:hypothetical protein